MDANARTDLGLKSQFQNASQWLHRFPPFNTYLQQVRSGKDVPKYDPDTDTDPWGSGVFEVTAREQHRLHLALGSDDYSVPKSHLERLIDEESVNTSLMVFLTALAAKYPLIKGQWTHINGFSERRLSLGSHSMPKWMATIQGKMAPSRSLLRPNGLSEGPTSPLCQCRKPQKLSHGLNVTRPFTTGRRPFFSNRG